MNHDMTWGYVFSGTQTTITRVLRLELNRDSAPESPDQHMSLGGKWWQIFLDTVIFSFFFAVPVIAYHFLHLFSSFYLSGALDGGKMLFGE